MAGRRQHHIPQFVLRSWASPESTDRTTRVWVFLKNKVIHASTKDVAVEKDFYSDRSKDGTETLDDQITEYEPALAAKLNKLRATPVGGATEPRLAGEVIAIPASPPTRGWNKTSTRSMPNMMRPSPISEAKPMPAGP